MKKTVAEVFLKKGAARKRGVVQGTDKPAVLKLPKVGKIKRVDIRKAVLVVRDRKLLVGR